VASVISVQAAEIESADSIQSVVGADFLTGVIKRAQASGSPEMLLVVDFARLIEGQFKAIGSAGVDTRSGAQMANYSANDDAELEASNDELRLVSFSVADQEYALDIAEVQEIVQLPETVSALPNAPRHVLGLISLRQRLLPLVSLRSLFGMAALPYTEQQRIVVTSLHGGLRVGLVTDTVKEVLSVPRAQTEAMPGLLATDAQLQEFTSICRLDEGKRLVSIIAADKLLHRPEITSALNAAVAASPGSTQTQPAEADAMQNDEIESREDEDAQVVIFRLGAEEFGVPIMSVQEIVRVPEALTRVPKTPDFVEGVINLRGTVLPVIDQRSRLGLPVIARSESQRIMVYMLDGMRTGFIVDSVAEVLRIPRAQISAAPAMSEEQSRLISQVANLQDDKRLVMLIDPQHLLHGQEMQAMQAQALDAGKSRGAAAELPALAKAA
jgi:purine-binding chemotaxis protein CheW